MRGAGMDLQDIFVAFYPFRLPAIALAQARRAGTKLKIPNRFAKGARQHCPHSPDSLYPFQPKAVLGKTSQEEYGHDSLTFKVRRSFLSLLRSNTSKVYARPALQAINLKVGDIHKRALRRHHDRRTRTVRKISGQGAEGMICRDLFFLDF